MTDRVIDCDVHCSVPSPAALSSFVAPHWAEFMRWTNFKAPGGVAFNYPAWSEMFAAKDGGLDAIRQSVLTAADRALLHCYFGVEGLGNPYLAAALAEAVNRWLAAQWLDADDRLRGSAVITPQHVPQAVEEIHRVAADGRFLQILLPVRSTEPYGNQRYWPIFEAAAEHDMVIALTYGGVPPVRWTPSFFEDYVLITGAFQTQITSLVMCGVFSRWPNLRVTVSESGWTWLPAHLWRMDQEWKAYKNEVPWLTERPSSYVRRHFRFTTQPTDASDGPDGLAESLDEIGDDEIGGDQLLLYASDYPHAYDGGGEMLMGLLDDAQRSRVLGGTAAEWYRL